MISWWEASVRESAEGKTPVLVVCEARAGFLAMGALDSVSKAQVVTSAKRRLMAEQPVFTDGLAALNVLADDQLHCPELTPPKQASKWLPWVHMAIANLKRFLLETFHGVSAKCLQEYLNEFYYRFQSAFSGKQTSDSHALYLLGAYRGILLMPIRLLISCMLIYHII